MSVAVQDELRKEVDPKNEDVEYIFETVTKNIYLITLSWNVCPCMLEVIFILK